MKLAKAHADIIARPALPMFFIAVFIASPLRSSRLGGERLLGFCARVARKGISDFVFHDKSSCFLDAGLLGRLVGRAGTPIGQERGGVPILPANCYQSVRYCNHINAKIEPGSIKSGNII